MRTVSPAARGAHPLARGSHPSTARRSIGLAAAASAAVMVLTGCAGGAGGDGTGGGAGEGYAAGAAQDEVDAALADLEPVEIVYQPSAASQASIQSPSGTVLAEAIEERSGGKIEVNMVWGQAIAGYGDLPDALSDGRVDLAYALPVYQPAEFPAVNAIGDALAGLDPSPFLGELVTNAVAVDVAWNSDEVLAEYTDRGLTPISPVVASGGYYSVCNSTGMTQDDFNGRQVRIASRTQSELLDSIGSSPVSMEYTETFEALQRGTVDCTLGQLVPSAESGIFAVAPHVGYMTDTSFSRAPGALVAGSGFQDLPLAYQQVIFDSYSDYYQGQMQTTIGGNADAIRQAKEAGGEIEEFDGALQAEIAEFNEENLRAIAEAGTAGTDLETAVTEAAQKWADRAAELDFADGGDLADMDEWYDTESDFRPLGEAIFDEVLLPHRPA